MRARELNFDGLVGPTHNYAGLSYGNVASMANQSAASSPRQAALQGLAKMKFMADLGVPQAVFPPHERPHLPTLRKRGYAGSDADVLAKVARDDSRLLAAVSSSSAMWAANAATVSPSPDTADGRVHFTPANLVSNLHRSIEAPTTARILRALFADDRHFAHHDPLPGDLPDEGAANHTRLCETYGGTGVELFTNGSSDETSGARPRKFPARQSLAASRAVASSHAVKQAVFVAQNPDAIDAGAFHNDVVAVGNRNVLLYHELAWIDAVRAIENIRAAGVDVRAIRVSDADVPLADAIRSYLFNSQLVTLPDGSNLLVAPVESRENERVRAALDGIGLPVRFVDVRQSMRNGGGPACLRLRVVLTDTEAGAMHPGVVFTDALYAQLGDWIERHYRDELTPADLADPKLLEESRAALDELTRMLDLGPVYEFQL